MTTSKEKQTLLEMNEDSFVLPAVVKSRPAKLSGQEGGKRSAHPS
ncbi:MAG: hypothetical protein QOJ64_521 [Acidobacteriota bacterium]|jgi:hypothetical protein|nr:hypothetical protein [Acidobacteriota bacterium]